MDWRKNGDKAKRKYAAFEPLIVESLYLFDTIRHDFRELYNERSPAAGRLKIVEQSKKGLFEYPFSGYEPTEYRLTKGATYPLFAAFRNCVIYDEAANVAKWDGGFDSVLGLWKRIGIDLVSEVRDSIKEIGNMPDQHGKSRSHWANMHKSVELHLLRSRLNKA
jgi:hypothetical protein